MEPLSTTGKSRRRVRKGSSGGAGGLLNVLRDSFAVLLSESKKLDRHVDSGLDPNHHTLAFDRVTWRDRSVRPILLAPVAMLST
jgi:hypothetical protein